MSKKILVTGAAGFIGFHVAEALLKHGNIVVGIDNINDYYDINLKFARLNESGILREEISRHKEVQSIKYTKYRFIQMDIVDKDAFVDLCKKESFDVVIHLAAQVNVRYSVENPDIYVQSNINGFFNVLEATRYGGVKQLIYASSSSVYGMNSKIPFSVEDKTDYPVSLYAATKKANELMAHAYSHLYKISVTGLRFFTVYGPWGRPDMAYFLFADAIRLGNSIKVFNHGKLKRDFTYIDDIVNGILRIVNKGNTTSYQIYNMGNDSPVDLLDFIKEIERNMGKEVVKEFAGMQTGDVPTTWANVDNLVKDYSYKPNMSIEKGIEKFMDWYKKYSV